MPLKAHVWTSGQLLTAKQFNNILQQLQSTHLKPVEDSEVTQIPFGAQLLSTGKPQDLNRLLTALILHMQQEEDEGLIVTPQDFERAKSYSLVVTDLQEEGGAMVLSVKPR